jgi:hypothetical protein
MMVVAVAAARGSSWGCGTMAQHEGAAMTVASSMTRTPASICVDGAGGDSAADTRHV